MVQIDFWPQMSDFTIIGMCTVSILQCKIAKNLEKCIGHTKDSFLQRESSLLLFNMWNVPIKKKKKKRGTLHYTQGNYSNSSSKTLKLNNI